MAVLYVAIVLAFARRVFARFLPDEPWLAAATILVAALFISAAVVAFGNIWSGVIEGMRVGNGHVSYRASRMPWRRQSLPLFGIGVVLFWLLALVRYRMAALRAPRRRVV